MRTFLPVLLTTALLGCSQLPTPRSLDHRNAHYVDAQTVARGEAPVGVPIITAVPLQHIDAVTAQKRLEPILPEGVRIGRTSRTDQLLIQGAAPDVFVAVQSLRAFDEG